MPPGEGLVSLPERVVIVGKAPPIESTYPKWAEFGASAIWGALAGAFLVLGALDGSAALLAGLWLLQFLYQACAQAAVISMQVRRDLVFWSPVRDESGRYRISLARSGAWVWAKRAGELQWRPIEQFAIIDIEGRRDVSPEPILDTGPTVST